MERADELARENAGRCGNGEGQEREGQRQERGERNGNGEGQPLTPHSSLLISHSSSFRLIHEGDEGAQRGMICAVAPLTRPFSKEIITLFNHICTSG